MQGLSDAKPPVKKLGELLFEAGFVTEAQLQKAVDISRKNFQSLGKVLVSTKTCSEAEVNNALEVQKLCKLEGMTGSIAVRTLFLIRKHKLTCKQALEKVGWASDTYKAFQEPADIAAARQALKNLGKTEGIPYGKALEAVGDAFTNNKLAARAQLLYDEAIQAYEKYMPVSAGQLTELLSKLSKLAIAAGDHNEAKRLLDSAHSYMSQPERKKSKEYGKLLHTSAEFHIARRDFSSAEQFYKDSFTVLEPLCGLKDPQVLQTIRNYVNIVDRGKRDDSQATLSEMWHDMAHEREPDKIALGELMKAARLLREEELTAAWQHSKESKVPLGRALVQLKLITERQLQHTLRAQTLVRNGELTAQLGIWLLLYACQLGLELDEVLDMFHCSPRSQSPLSEELKTAAIRIQEMEQRLPPTHPELAFAHARLARIYFYRQQYVEADQHYKRGVEIVSANPNVPPDSVVELLDHYAEVKLALEDAAETIRIAKTAVQVRSKYYGQESVPYARGVEKLGQVFCATGDHYTAISGFDRALAVREKLYGSQDRELVGCLMLKADCLLHAGEKEAAEQVYDQCLAVAEKGFGRYHENTEKVRKKLVHLCKSLGKIEKVRQLLPGSIKEDDYFQI
jgi:tetratricopeptide (TPR) repeat protein